MPSWIKVHSGNEWYDLAYTTSQTNQSFDQLAKKVDKGSLSAFQDEGGKWWFLQSDVERLRAAFLKRQQTAKQWKPSNSQIEARATRKWEAELERERKARVNRNGSYGPGYVGPVAAHHERVMLKEIDLANAARKKKGE